MSLWNEKRILRAATQEDPKDNNSLSPLLYEGRKEKSMIKAEKTGNKMELEIKGATHDLIREFDAVLKAMCEVLDRNLVKAAPFTVEDLLHTMVHNAALKEERERDEHENQ